MQGLFGRNKGLLQQATRGQWKNDAERQALLEQCKGAGFKAVDLVPLLAHKDSGFRAMASDAVAGGADRKVLKAVLELMASQPSHIKGYMRRVVIRMPEPLVEKALAELIEHTDIGRRRMGWEVVLDLGPPLRDPWLKRALQDAPTSIKVTALQRLLQDRVPSEMVAELEELANSQDSRLATVAIEALAKVDDPRVIDLMLERFGSPDARVREVAVRYLRDAAQARPADMRGKMTSLLAEGEDATRRLSVEILLATGEPREVLSEILAFCTSLVGWLRTRILETLQTFGETLLRPAVQLLEHPDEDIRIMALVLAEQFDDPRIVGPVCKMLDDDDWWLRVTACETLGRLKATEAVPRLIQALQDEDCRWAAIEALGRIGSPKALKPFVAMLRSPRQELRMEVVNALAHFEDERLLPMLQAVQQKDPSSEVRTRASEVHRSLSQALNKVSTISESQTVAVSSSSLKKPIDKLLAMIREKGHSDLHLTVGEPPFVRDHGELTRMSIKPLTAQATESSILSILDERQRAILKEKGEIDFCYAVPEVGRYRANAFWQRKGLCAAFRVIPNIPPTFSDLGLPGRLTELLDYHQGIIVVSGPAGSGKSTTLAAIVNLINESKAEHILTIEDPIEFVHPVKSSLINQREVGRHTESFARALRGALREDPDVIVVGEMRDAETTRMALTAAETGHLVVATMHTTSAVQTVERLIKSFPPEEQPQVRMALSEALKYVICQSLLPRADGKGRVAVFEILKGTFSVGNLIRDNKSYQLPGLMQIGQRVGMQTVDNALMELFEAGKISAEAAWLRAENQEMFTAHCEPDFLKGNTGDANE